MVERQARDVEVRGSNSGPGSSLSLEFKFGFYCPLCYNSGAHCPLLQCLCTRSAILADAHTYFVVSSFKREGKK